jgi:hypothetical protein
MGAVLVINSFGGIFITFIGFKGAQYVAQRFFSF